MKILLSKKINNAVNEYLMLITLDVIDNCYNEYKQRIVEKKKGTYEHSCWNATTNNSGKYGVDYNSQHLIHIRKVSWMYIIIDI